MLSELDAVNMMLAAIGSAPVNTLAGVVSPDVAIARQLLTDARRKMLLRGWAFNTQRGVTIAPDDTGRIPVDTNILRIDLSPVHSGSTDPVQRGAWLFDRTSNSFTFSGSIVVDLLLDLPWDDLPEVARAYTAASAAEMLAHSTAADPQRVAGAQRATYEAYAALRSYEDDAEDATIFDDYQSKYITRRYR